MKFIRRLIRWFRYEDTKRWSSSILIHRSHQIRRGVADMRRYMESIGLTGEEARQLWDRAIEAGVAQRHPKFYMEREWCDD